jgi:hypothetical protein
MEQAQHAGWFLPHTHICWVSERHCVLERDERGRLHSVAGPAVAYPDGWAIYAVHGVRVPERVIMSPESYTADELRGEKNSEISRVLAERIGWPKYLDAMGVVSIDRWTDPNTGLAYELLDLRERRGDQQPRWLKMRSPKLNDATEPDFIEPVHPGCKTAQAARRWQFRSDDGSWPEVSAANKNPLLHFMEEK